MTSTSSLGSPRNLGIIAAIASLVADQASKFYLLYVAGFAHMGPTDSIPVLPFLTW